MPFLHLRSVGVTIKWTKKGNQEIYLNDTSRRLRLNNVTKQNHQGVYVCTAEFLRGGPKLNVSYVLTVVGENLEPAYKFF